MNTPNKALLMRERAMKARQAQQAGAPTEEVVEELRKQQAASAPAAAPAATPELQAPSPQAQGSPDAPRGPARASFAALARRPEPAPPVVPPTSPPASSPTQRAEDPPHSVSRPAPAQPARKGGFGGLSRGVLHDQGDNVPEHLDDDASVRPASPSPAPTGRTAFSDLARRSGERRRQLDEAEAQRASAVPRAQVPDPGWDHPTIPAGSKYSPEEWAAARAQGNVYVWEVRNAGECALMVADKPKPQRVRKVMGRGGKPVDELVPYTDEELADSFDPTYGWLLDGCLLLSPNAPTTHPGAVNGIITLTTEDPVLIGPVQVPPGPAAGPARDRALPLRDEDALAPWLEQDADGRRARRAQKEAAQQRGPGQLRPGVGGRPGHRGSPGSQLPRTGAAGRGAASA